MFKNILIILLTLATIFFAWIACTITVDPIQRAYEKYNHIQLYEDGSFTGEDLEGNQVSGCIKNGLCND